LINWFSLIVLFCVINSDNPVLYDAHIEFEFEMERQTWNKD